MKIVFCALATVLVFSATLAQSQPPVPAPQIEEKAKVILRDNEKAMSALKTYTAKCETARTSEWDGKTNYEMATLTAAKPNRVRYDVWDMVKGGAGAFSKKEEMPKNSVVCDGATVYRQEGKAVTFSKETGPEKLWTGLEPWMGFHSPEKSLRAYFAVRETDAKTLEILKYVGQETVEGTLCDVIAYKYHSGTRGKDKEGEFEIRFGHEGTLYFSPDKLARRQVETLTTGLFREGKLVRELRMTTKTAVRNMKTNFPTPPESTFAYTLPEGVTLKAEKPRIPLLAAGTTAPDFIAHDRNGKPVKLSDFRGKVVVLDFWATWCGPCIASMPATNRIAKAHRDKGVVVLAVNVWDSLEAFKDWLPKNTQYDALQFLIDPAKQEENIAENLYGVTGIPTQFVIDAKGIIRASLVGAGPEEQLEKAIREARQ